MDVVAHVNAPPTASKARIVTDCPTGQPGEFLPAYAELRINTAYSGSLTMLVTKDAANYMVGVLDGWSRALRDLADAPTVAAEAKGGSAS